MRLTQAPAQSVKGIGQVKAEWVVVVEDADSPTPAATVATKVGHERMPIHSTSGR